MNDVTLPLLDFANSHGGHYDGWETEDRRPDGGAVDDDFNGESAADET